MIKKAFFIIVLSVFFLLMISCGGMDKANNPDGISFSFLDNALVNDETATIYKINDKKDVYYAYKQLSKPTSDRWIINYIYTHEYAYTNEDYLSINNQNSLYESLYDVILKDLSERETSFNLVFNYHENGYQEERELVIDNTHDEAYLIDLYIPYKVTFKNSRNNFIVMIPVYTFVAYKDNNKLVFNNETFEYDLFLQKSNVFKK